MKGGRRPGETVHPPSEDASDRNPVEMHDTFDNSVCLPDIHCALETKRKRTQNPKQKCIQNPQATS